MRIYDQSNDTRLSERLGTTNVQQIRSNYAGAANRYQGATLDRVDVSDLADTMDRVLSADQQSRSAEVEKLTQVYQSGQYSVDDERLTDAIMADMDADRAQTGL